jgi:hypothetical protein
MNDLRYAFRSLLKSPGFTAVAVLTLALAIGANTAIFFSSLNGLLLQSLPVGEPAELVLFSDDVGEGTSSGDPFAGVWERFSFDAYRYFAENVPAFQSLAAFRSGEARVSVVGEARGSGAALAQSHLVSPNSPAHGGEIHCRYWPSVSPFLQLSCDRFSGH